jgi:uncharacterized integral membrane protein
MKRALQLIVFVPLAVVCLALAVANRHTVIVSFDPFSTDETGDIQAPLFIVLIFAVMFGLVLGSLATWFAQGKYRRALRDTRAEAQRLRSDAGHVKA